MHIKICPIIVLSAMVATTGSIAFAQDENSANGNNGAAVSSHVVSPEDAQKTQDYWTPERMQNAKPMDMNINGAAPAGVPDAGTGTDAAQPSGASPPPMENKDSER